MNPVLTPGSLSELVDAVRSAPRVVPVGGGTKPRLSAAPGIRIRTSRLSGIVEYEPDEFTVTARAGTPIRELVAVLAAKRQHLPFDPPLGDAGATLGGTVAAGLSGPGRFRFGGVRDFILGVRFVDGSGRLLRLGGKVVKNAAGFDLPKFLCGSLGRFGVLGEMTFKVFPRPESTRTLRLHAATPAERLRIITVAGRSRWEPDALEGAVDGFDVWMRLAGPAKALDAISREVLSQFPGDPMDTGEAGTEAEAEAVWSGFREFHWAHAGGILIKVPVSPAVTLPLHLALDGLPGTRVQIGAGGHVAWVSLESADAHALVPLGDVLARLRLGGLTVRGNAPLWVNRGSRPAVETAVKLALDPVNRFPPLDS